jgi:hypothetical protein
MRSLLLQPCCIVFLLAIAGTAAAAGNYLEVSYPPSTQPGELQLGVTYTLWIPDGVTTFRGIIVHQHGCGSGACKGGETAAYDLHWQALAKKWECALLGPSYHQDDKQIRWLEAKSKEMIRASRRTMKSGIAAFPPQAGSGYEAFWLRDYAYMLEGCPEAFSDRELRDACLLFVNSARADGAGVDCVKFDGTPIYKPGFGTMGENPVADGGPFTVDVAWHTHRRLRDKQLVVQIADRLVKTMMAVPRNPRTGMVYIKPEGYDRCPYGFTDTVRKQGDELFTSILWIQAARQLADLLEFADRRVEAGKWRAEAERIAAAVPQVFWDEKVGLFRAATLKCREPDIWGSAFAVYLGVASRDESLRIARYFKDHYTEIVEHGQLRHLPGGVYWEAACPRDTYQNGGCWATPVGWFIYTLDLVDRKLADRTIVDLVGDFQTRGVTEWVRGDHQAVRNYIASATMPLAGARAMLKRRCGQAGATASAAIHGPNDRPVPGRRQRRAG